MTSRWKTFLPAPWPRASLAIVFVALTIQLAGAGPVRDALIYDRIAVATGQLWRLWTGHLCHFGWLHFFADAGLFLIIGWALERRFPRADRFSLIALPLFVGAALYFTAPELSRYAGLSGVNVGLLVFLSLDAWHRHQRDWFWPAVLLVHALELLLESLRGGAGGGAIRFDESGIRIATAAHLAGATYGLLWFLTLRALGATRRSPGSRLSAPGSPLQPAQLSRNSSQAI